MRQDWDFVLMGDYQADMKESAETAAAAIEFLKSRERDALRRAEGLALALADALRQLGSGARARVPSNKIAGMRASSQSADELIYEYSPGQDEHVIRLSHGKPKD